VSEREQIERAAFEEVLRQMPARVVVAEAPSGEIIFLNSRSQQVVERGGSGELHGRSVFEALDSTVFSALHSDGRPYGLEEWPLIRSITSGEDVRDEEIVYLLPDGRRSTVRYDSSPIYDEEGRIVAGVVAGYDITEQKRAEKHLRYHASLLQNIHDAVIATDERYIITTWNEGAERMFGWTADEAIGRRVYELIPTDYSDEQLEEALRELAETGRRRSEGLRYRKDGTSFNADVLTIALRGEQGEVTGYLGVHRDITERKRAEDQLRESNRRTEDILESISDAFFTLDREWRYTYLNERALDRILEAKGEELTREVLMGKNCWEVFPETVGTRFDQELHRALSEQRTVEFESYSPPLSRWVGVHAYPSKEGLTVYVQDITDRKEAEKEVEIRTRQQAAVADLGLRALANDNLQLLMDETAALVARILGVEYSKVVELLPGGEELLLRAGVGWREGLVGVARESAGEGSEAGYTLRSNEPVIMEDLSTEERFATTPLLEEHGVISGMSVVIYGGGGPFGALCAHSRSHRSFSEDDINFLQSVANVLAIAIERQGAEERVEEVREAERSRIARDLHDEALQDVSGALVDAQRLKAFSTDPQAARLSERLLASLDRVEPHLRGVIYDLSLEREHDRPFDVLLENMVELQRTIAPHLQIALETQREGIFEGSLGERDREILRIIGEALTNARRHADATNVLVRVGISEGILFGEVEDDGRGFDPTQEEPTSPATTTTGEGVGMRSMHERANHLGGELMIEGEPGEGTKVRFELALHRESEELEEEEVRLLLVEDHASIREALASSFEGEDFEVVGQAGSMAEARRMLEEIEQPIDVALIDLGLPDGYGAELIKEVQEKNPKAQALVLSASLERANIARAVELGAAGVLSKTAHLEEVVDAVRRLRAGETLMPLEEVVELLRFAGSEREQAYETRQAIERLTPREIEVLQALAEGLDSEEIADKLNIALRTERNHMASILKKLGVHSQLEALVFALRYGGVEVP
jgi:PAS domain S-box-containing protein